jgi:transglutaminase-like putative cysteine protease
MTRRPAAPGSQPAAAGSLWRWVAVAAAVAVGAVGAVAAERADLSPVLGALGGALAATLAVLALPSLPTRRATILLLGVAGLGALRHGAFPGSDSAVLLLAWASGTLVALLLADRADAEAVEPMPGGAPLPRRVPETLKNTATIVVLVIVAAVALVPTVTDRLGRRVWPGETPGFDDLSEAPSSLSWSRRLDMTTRPRLGDAVVFTVDAQRPDFWRGETFDVWDGRAWTRSDQRARVLSRAGDAVALMTDPLDDNARRGTEFRQTFRLEAGYSSVLFAAPSPVRAEVDRVIAGRDDGTAFLPGRSIGGDGFGRGAVYTVTSRSLLATAEDLRAAGDDYGADVLRRYTQIPPSTPARVQDLAREVTAGIASPYDQIRALEAWLGANTRYSLDAPLSPEGVDVVDDFLFRSRLGWCEQVASSLVVMARGVGIPARLVTGFVPGERDGLTGRFVVHERDAHAWAEVYFPGIGWQGFDPTASVPLAGEAESGGSWLDALRDHALELLVLVAGAVAVFLAAPKLTSTWRRRTSARRAGWAERTLARLEGIGAQAERPRRPAETPREYAHAVGRRVGDPRFELVGDTLDAHAYSAREAPSDVRDEVDAVLSSHEPDRRRPRRRQGRLRAVKGIP